MAEPEIGSYEWYTQNYTNPSGQELEDYTPQKWSGLTPKQWEAKEALEVQRSDQATADFYEKYGLTPPEA